VEVSPIDGERWRAERPLQAPREVPAVRPRPAPRQGGDRPGGFAPEQDLARPQWRRAERLVLDEPTPEARSAEVGQDDVRLAPRRDGACVGQPPPAARD